MSSPLSNSEGVVDYILGIRNPPKQSTLSPSHSTKSTLNTIIFDSLANNTPSQPPFSHHEPCPNIQSEFPHELAETYSQHLQKGFHHLDPTRRLDALTSQLCIILHTSSINSFPYCTLLNTTFQGNDPKSLAQQGL